MNAMRALISDIVFFQVRVNMDLRWAPEEDIAMSVDCGEEEWRRLHDIRQASDCQWLMYHLAA